MDRLLTGFLGQPLEGLWSPESRSQPAVNVWEEKDALVAELEVPGLQGDQLDIAVVGGELSIKIERPDLSQEGVKYHRRERPVGTFSRTLRLPVDIDAGKVQAELNDGVLTITMPKAEEAKPRKIQVSQST
jgi:HSP20 family protein